MELVFDNITKTYGKTRALTDFTATLQEGVYALLGPNGSGKSTLMNILAGILKADSGSIRFNNENVQKMGSRFREIIGFMPQYPGLYGSFTAKDYLFYMATLKGIKKASAESLVKEVLEAVALSDVAGHRISTFSGGMKQRLSLAQSVLGDPSVLILDEPTAGLDPKQRIEIRNYISRISFNKIVIIATHVVPDIEYIARNVLILKKGILVDNASPEELLRKIDGSVWRVKTTEDKVVQLQKDFKVTNILKDDDGVSVRILSDQRPTENAYNVSPTLDDYYLHIFEDN